MKKVFESLKNYFENTPNEQIEKDWEELKKYNEIGPDIEEFLFVQKQFAKDMENQNNREMAENKEKERERVLRLLEVAESDVNYFRNRLAELDKRTLSSKISEVYPILGRYIKVSDRYGYVSDIRCYEDTYYHIYGLCGPHFTTKQEKYDTFSYSKNVENGLFANIRNISEIQFITKKEFEEKLNSHLKNVSNRLKENCKVVQQPFFLNQCDSETVMELRERFKKDVAYE